MAPGGGGTTGPKRGQNGAAEGLREGERGWRPRAAGRKEEAAKISRWVDGEEIIASLITQGLGKGGKGNKMSPGNRNKPPGGGGRSPGPAGGTGDAEKLGAARSSWHWVPPARGRGVLGVARGRPSPPPVVFWDRGRLRGGENPRGEPGGGDLRPGSCQPRSVITGGGTGTKPKPRDCPAGKVPAFGEGGALRASPSPPSTDQGWGCPNSSITPGWGIGGVGAGSEGLRVAKKGAKGGV